MKSMPENNLIPLPASAETHPGRNLPAPMDYFRSNMMAAAAEAERANSSVPLSHYLWILRRHWWKILLFVGARRCGAPIWSPSG